MTYLDHNATTPLRQEVRSLLIEALDDWGNPSSDHPIGQRARARLEEAREQVAAFLGAAPAEIVFTSGGTESSNMAILGVPRSDERRRVVTSSIEHPATAVPCAHAGRHGDQVLVLPVDEDGRVTVAEATGAIGATTVLVTVMHANNETGAVQPIAELSGLAHRHGALMHTDAAQSAGKVPVNVRDLGVDLLTLAGHKMYAPKGVGVLYVRDGTPLNPFMLGAGHEDGRRPGTENVAYAAALGLACELAARDLDEVSGRMASLRDGLWEQLSQAIPGLLRNGPATDVLPNTLNVSFPGVHGRDVLAGAPSIMASTGSACHEGGTLVPSGVLIAMGRRRDEALGAVRLSLGRGTTEAEVRDAGNELIRSYASAMTTA